MIGTRVEIGKLAVNDLLATETFALIGRLTASVVCDDEATESVPVPTVFVAFTLNVYAVLAVNPVQLYVVLFPPTAQTAPDGVEVTV